MPKAYSIDLRWRAVWLAIVRGISTTEIAHILFMCEASVSRYLTLFHTTGDVAPRKHSSGPDKMLNELEQFTVLQTLIHRSTSYLSEVQDDCLMLQALGQVQVQSVVQ